MPTYAFGPFVLDPAEHWLTRRGRRVAVPAKAWQILLLLAEAGGRLVPHETFRAKLWPNIVVEDRTLTVHMSTLRKALGADPPADCIETVARAGYRLSVPVRVLSETDPRQRVVSGTPIEARPLAVRIFSTGDLAEADTYLVSESALPTRWPRYWVRCPALPYRRSAPWMTSPARAMREPGTCWRARCGARPKSCMCRHA